QAFRATRKLTNCGWDRAFRRSESTSSARRTISGRWAIPVHAARAARFITTWESRLPTRAMRIARLVAIADDMSRSGTWCSCSSNPLPKPSIDTGMGLERVASVLQGIISNYDTDLFTPLIKRAAELTGASLKKEVEKEAHQKSAASLRVIADHSRAATFLISDGVL